MRTQSIETRNGEILPRLCAVALVAALAACGNFASDGETTYPEDDNRKTGQGTYDSGSLGSVFGEGGLSLGGEETAGPGTGGGGGIGVNSFLWRASLDTVSFMPLASADPFGGVIISDWYTPPDVQNERFKINVFILGRELRADGIRARVFRQQRDGVGAWLDSRVAESTNSELEDAILTRARQMRIAALQ